MLIEKIFLTRREILKAYIAELPLPGKGQPKTQAQLAEKLGFTPKHFGQFVAEPLKDGEKYKGWRAISIEEARRWEPELDLPVGYFDGDDVGNASLQVLESRLHKQGNDINALLYSVGALAAVVSLNRQDEGEMISGLLRKVVDPKYLQFEGSVVAVLDVVESVTNAVKARKPARKPARH